MPTAPCMPPPFSPLLVAAQVLWCRCAAAAPTAVPGASPRSTAPAASPAVPLRQLPLAARRILLTKVHDLLKGSPPPPPPPPDAATRAKCRWGAQC